MRHRSGDGQRQGYERTTARSQGREPGKRKGTPTRACVRGQRINVCIAHRIRCSCGLRARLDSRLYETRVDEAKGVLAGIAGRAAAGAGAGRVKVKGKTEVKGPWRGIRGDGARTRNESQRPVRGGDGDPVLGDLGLDSQGFTSCTSARGTHRPVRNGRGACGSREESRCAMRTGEQGRFPYCCWHPGVCRPEAVVPKIYEVHKRETAIPPFFFSGCRGGREEPGWGEEPVRWG
ncbi:hypothetical protein B0H13DRAFT_1046975 [Mycena leptocephala]|nr:hypothetical protein B0H13DRAFT_1046975 [Mycena leptocephala]